MDVKQGRTRTISVEDCTYHVNSEVSITLTAEEIEELKSAALKPWTHYSARFIRRLLSKVEQAQGASSTNPGARRSESAARLVSKLVDNS